MLKPNTPLGKQRLSGLCYYKKHNVIVKKKQCNKNKESKVLCCSCNYNIHSDQPVIINTNYMSNEIITTRLYVTT